MEELHCYCNSNKEPCMIRCTSCKKFFHPACLKKGNPSPLVGDVFFHLICTHCNKDGIEYVSRIKLQWTQVILLTLYNLQFQSGGKCGYYRWRENICSFIEKYWTTFFGYSKKKSSTWHGTVAGALSSGEPQYFRSGTAELKESGWWALADCKLSDICNLDMIQERSKKSKQAAKKSLNHEKRSSALRSRGSKPSFQAAIELKERRSSLLENKDIKKKKKKSDGEISSYGLPYSQTVGTSHSNPPSNVGEDSRDPTESDSSALDWNICDESTDSWFTEKGLKPDENLPQLLLKDDDTIDLTDIEIDPGLESPAMSIGSPKIEDLFKVIEKAPDVGKIVKQENEETPLLSDSESESDSIQNEELDDQQQQRRKRKTSHRELMEKEQEIDIVHVPLSIYEEKCLLERLQEMNAAVDQCVEARQLRRRLLVRQVKRQRNLPIFDLDLQFKRLKGFPDYLVRKQFNENRNPSTLNAGIRILDRYHTNTNKSHNRNQQTPSFLTRLVGRDEHQLENIISPYTARVLKPFIWRDYETVPPKLKLLHEIVAHHHRHDPSWVPEQRAPIDYCYVQPHHIPSVNAFCQEFFWPGINLSECLQYPDFSCIAMYRKMVIGFSFMVPDVKYNEAYITFIFTHPEWRKSGIATFMLYHLIQTCMGKDVTLHVSATNPAVFLYQKFGFKLEEFILDFYDKYYPIDSKECKHSFFFRLSH